MAPKLNYVIVFVAGMNAAVRFYRDTLGLKLKFESPDWSEFATGDTTLALHISSPQNPPGKVEPGFGVENMQQFHAEMTAKGVPFPMPPTKQDFGMTLAQMQDRDGTVWSVSGP
ncbi:MAG: VOC family protein [Candidatus Acidiferrales bacterium]